FDTNFQRVTTLAGSFSDPDLPAGADPFNIQAIGGNLVVTYTGPSGGARQGAVAYFNADGQAFRAPRIVGGPPNQPWGVALAPTGFGPFGGDLLVGNVGDGRINAFDPGNGTFLGTLTLPSGRPFHEDHLRGLTFGVTPNGSASPLFFTAGINNGQDGL